MLFHPDVNKILGVGGNITENTNTNPSYFWCIFYNQ
jgi:hypothetical protein